MSLTTVSKIFFSDSFADLMRSGQLGTPEEFARKYLVETEGVNLFTEEDVTNIASDIRKEIAGGDAA